VKLLPPRPAVAFLQNAWFRNPEKVRDQIARGGEPFRRKLLEYALFAGCLTGRRIRTAFGEDLCGLILWEETTREIAGDPKTVFPADLGHMAQVLADHHPRVVLAFGRIAAEALGSLNPPWTGPVVTLPHPAARQPDTLDRLRLGAGELHTLLEGVPA